MMAAVQPFFSEEQMEYCNQLLVEIAKREEALEILTAQFPHKKKRWTDTILIKLYEWACGPPPN